MFSTFRTHLYKTRNSENSKLRVGLMLNDSKLIRVFAEVVKDLKASDFVDIRLVIVRNSGDKKKIHPKSVFEKIWGLRKHILDKYLRSTLFFRLYSLLDDRRNKEIPYFDEVSIDDLLKGIPCVEVQPFEKGFSDYFSSEDSDFVKSQNLDVLFRFGFRILRGDILEGAKYGVWSYHHGDQDYYRGSPPYFWEMVEGAYLNGAVLQILNEKLDGGKVLIKGRFASEKSMSIKKNKVAPYLGSQHFVIDQLRRLHSLGWAEYSKLLEPTTPYCGKRAIYRSPTNFEMFNWFKSRAAEKLANRLNRREVVSHWRIGLRKKQPNDGEVLSRFRNGLIENDYRWFDSPKGHFWADPVLYDLNGVSYLFFEDYIYEQKRAVIACAVVTSNLDLIDVTTVLDTGAHASFPFVFNDGQCIYMVPETFEDGTVSLYKSESFPHAWTKVKVLINLPCVDTVVWKQNGLWWLSTSYNFNKGHAHTKLLFSCETLLGDWTLHPDAPFAPDVRYARNAGPILHTSDGKSYRVSQSAEYFYGGSIAFHEINELSSSHYREALVLKVGPASNSTMRGIHSFTTSENFEGVDGVWNELFSEVALRR
jgi:hypothetical protein